MSLDKLRIPGIVLKELYPSQLVEPAGAMHIPVPEPTIPPATRNAEVMVIVNGLPEGAADLLSKILQACKWSLHRTTLINLQTQPETWARIRQQGLPRICLLLGAEAMAIELPVVFPPFRIQAFDGVKFVAAPGIMEIEADRLLKSKLWLCCKELFNLP